MDKTKERNSHGAESQGGYRRRTLALEATGIIYFYDKSGKEVWMVNLQVCLFEVVVGGGKRAGVSFLTS